MEENSEEYNYFYKIIQEQIEKFLREEIELNDLKTYLPKDYTQDDEDTGQFIP